MDSIHKQFVSVSRLRHSHSRSLHDAWPLAKRIISGHDESMNDLENAVRSSPTDRPTTAATTFTLFAAFRVSSSHPSVADGRDVPGLIQELEDVVEMLANEDVAVRGWYDVSGMQHDADLLVLLDGEAAEDLQWGLRELRRTALLKPLIRVAGTIAIAPQASPQPLPEEAKLWLALAQRGSLDLALVEGDELSSLRDLVSELPADPFIGRYIEPIEIIEVLQ